MRVLVLALALAASACGSDNQMPPISSDLSQPLIDLSMAGLSCGPTTCAGSCAACVSIFGGLCATTCKLGVAGGCIAPATCRPASASSDGGVSVQLGGACSGIDGYCL